MFSPPPSGVVGEGSRVKILPWWSEMQCGILPYSEASIDFADGVVEDFKGHVEFSREALGKALVAAACLAHLKFLDLFL